MYDIIVLEIFHLIFVERRRSPFLLNVERPISIKLCRRPASTSFSGMLCPLCSCTVGSATLRDIFEREVRGRPLRRATLGPEFHASIQPLEREQRTDLSKEFCIQSLPRLQSYNSAAFEDLFVKGPAAGIICTCLPLTLGPGSKHQANSRKG